MVEIKNLPLLLGMSPEADRVVDEIMSGKLDIVSSLLKLGGICKVKIKFNRPVPIGRRQVLHTEYVFPGFFMSGTGFCYSFKKNGRRGYYMPSPDSIVSYAPVVSSVDTFTSYEAFKRKFDPIFITDSEISKLWNSTSSQTGVKYRPSDFKSLGREGVRLVRRFLNNFKGVQADNQGYVNSGYGDYLSLHHYSNGSRGRDLKVSHNKGGGYVYYASEFPGCGNGTYGLIANKYTYLHLEDD